jgi:imidazolonepropionase-like amidohydrolase
MSKFKFAGAIAALALVAGPAAAETVAITNARIHTMGPAGVIPSGSVVIRDGRIAAVGASVQIPQGARVIDAQGGVVTPGLIATGAALGLLDVSAVGSDAGTTAEGIGAAFDVQYGLNPDSVTLPAARLGGVTRAIVTPSAGSGGGGGDHETAGAGGGDQSAPSLFAGQAAAIHLGRGRDILMRPRIAVSVDMGAGGAQIAGGARGATFVALKSMLDDVRHFARNRSAYDRGETRDYGLSRADLEALVPVVEGRTPLIVSVHRAADIRQALRFAREERLRIVLEDVEEGWLVAGEIAAAGVPVIINPLANLPGNFETLGSTIDNAARLNAAGVTVIVDGGSAGAHRVREMRYNAGNAVAHGLPYETALRAMTINPATAFGLSGQIGSLEPGKDADVVIWSGDPLEPLTQPSAVFIRGEEQPLTSRGIELARRYRAQDAAYPPAYR